MNFVQEKTILLPTSKGNLTGMLGASPETLSRAFAKLAETGIIRMSGKKIGILDMHKLEALSV